MTNRYNPITASQMDLDVQAYLRGIQSQGTGPRAGFRRAALRMTDEHRAAHHAGAQTTKPLPGTRAQRRRVGR